MVQMWLTIATLEDALVLRITAIKTETDTKLP
jgi:hypothetical protein